MAVGCGAQSAEQEGSQSSALADAPQQTTPSAQAVAKASSRAPKAARAELRANAGVYELEVQSPTGFSPQAFDPVLRVGDKEFSRSTESKLVGEYGAVFLIEKADFDTLADASDISVGFGRGFARPVALGRLDKASLTVK